MTAPYLCSFQFLLQCSPCALFLSLIFCPFEPVEIFKTVWNPSIDRISRVIVEAEIGTLSRYTMGLHVRRLGFV